MQTAIVERVAVGVRPKAGAPLGLKALALAGAGLALAIGAGWYATEWWRTGRFIEVTDDAYAGGNVTAVSPHVPGFIAEIPVADNQHVEPGQLLIRLDDRDFKAAFDRARAAADEKKAALAALEAKYALQQATIRQAEADLAAKTAAAGFARQEALRYRTLAATPAGTRQTAERAAANDQEAQSAVRSSEAGLAAARQQLTVLNAEIAAARAGIAQANAELETATLDLGYTEIRSPIEGYVGNRAAQVGAYATSGSYLVSVIPARGLWIDANFKEDQLAHIHPGQPATVATDARPGKVFHGHILSLSPGTGAIFSVIPPENATGNFTKIVQRVPVRIALDDPDARLGEIRPGLSATVRVDTRPERRDRE